MAKLNQIIAIEADAKQHAQEALRAASLTFRDNLVNGMTRQYTPLDEDGERLPGETQYVQVRVEEALRELSKELTKFFDLTLTKDHANALAKADIVVDGKAILKAVPVVYLLFLEKQLLQLDVQIVHQLPTLDATEDWALDPGQGLYITKEVITHRNRKVPQRFIKAEATREHPAQVDVYHEDVPIGTWKMVKRSGALSRERATTLKDRVRGLRAAVKKAREEANLQQVADVKAGEAIFDYLLA